MACDSNNSHRRPDTLICSVVHIALPLLRALLLLRVLLLPQVLRQLLRVLRPAPGQEAQVSRRALRAAAPLGGLQAQRAHGCRPAGAFAFLFVAVPTDKIRNCDVTAAVCRV